VFETLPRPPSRAERAFLRRLIREDCRDPFSLPSIAAMALLVLSFVTVMVAYVSYNDDFTRAYLFLAAVGLYGGGTVVLRIASRRRAAVADAAAAHIVTISGPVRVQQVREAIYTGNRVSTFTTDKTFIGEQEVRLPLHWTPDELEKSSEGSAEVLCTPWGMAYAVSMSDGSSAEKDMAAGLMNSIDIPPHHTIMALLFASLAVLTTFTEMHKHFTTFPPAAFVRYLGTMGAEREFADAVAIARHDGLRLHQPVTVQSCTGVPIMNEQGWSRAFVSDVARPELQTLSRLRGALRERLASITEECLHYYPMLDVAPVFDHAPRPSAISARIDDNPHVAVLRERVARQRQEGNEAAARSWSNRDIPLELIRLFQAEPRLVARRVNAFMADHLVIPGAPYYTDDDRERHLSVSAGDVRDHTMRYERLEDADPRTLRTLARRTHDRLNSYYAVVDSLLHSLDSAQTLTGIVKPVLYDTSWKASGLRPLVIDADERNDGKVFSMGFLTVLYAAVIGYGVFLAVAVRRSFAVKKRLFKDE
jgi:hypothetical protein